MGDRKHMRNLCMVPQFCCEAKTAPKINKVFKKRYLNNHGVLSCSNLLTCLSHIFLLVLKTPPTLKVQDCEISGVSLRWPHANTIYQHPFTARIQLKGTSMIYYFYAQSSLFSRQKYLRYTEVPTSFTLYLNEING